MLKVSMLFHRAWQVVPLGVVLLAVGAPQGASAQRVLWADAPVSTAARQAALPVLSHYRPVTVQLQNVRSALSTAPSATNLRARTSTTVVSLPLPDGTSQRFRVVQVPVMAPELAARYPNIRTYAAQGIDDPTATARLDVSSAGFHAMILTANKTVYIDPAQRGGATDGLHLVFERQAMNRTAIPFVCNTPDSPALPTTPPLANRQNVANGTTLRTYRLALACTGEYAAYYGGTKEGALAGMVASLNRVNGIYEKELAVRMVLVPKNDTLIYLDGATDPYTNDNGESMLNQNQTTVDARIGNANYDIGHVFSTGGGGIAQKPSVCISGKARGVTGSGAPRNDAFDVDYVAHEIGHQFGADHTFNSVTSSCGGGNRAGASAYEPGSGTTIMAYAGICGADNTQANSDPYFHSRSFDQIVAHITGAGNCAVSTATNNTPPVVNAGSDYAIPISTPFTLTGSATDANGDALTYSWEQYNLGPEGAPNSPSGNAPLFRVFAPVSSPSRTFPRLSDIVNNTQTRGELLPSYGRTLTFRLVTRDNRVGGGGVDYDAANVTVVGTAGPFVVTAPNTATTWLGGAPQSVTWDVANTTAAPINAANVDILLSTDGGLTYPITLLAGTPNDGCESITLPTGIANTSTARIRVQASGGIFFDISNANFSILTPTAPTFYLAQTCTSTPLIFCAGTASGTVPLSVGSLLGFTGNVALSASGLPTDATITFSNPTIASGSATMYTINTTTATPAGVYTITLTGTSGSITQSQQVRFQVLPIVSQATAVSVPTFSGRTILRPTISWAPVPNASSYDVQVATDANFSTLVFSQSGVTGTSLTLSTGLQSNTTYFVRVRGVGICGAAPYSATVQFQTGQQTCQTIAATTVPRTISAGSANTVTSTLTVTTAERVSDIRIRNLAITHPNVGELEISLTNPAGTRVVLFSRLCNGTSNLSLSFDDAATAVLACPLPAGGTVRPANPLSTFLNSASNGTWTLTITDNNAGNDGTLTGWSLELCTVPEAPTAPTSLTTTAPIAVGNNSANLEVLWLDNSANETGFELERSTNNGTYTRIATLGANTVFYEDQVSTNARYCYRVRAVNAVGSSAYSNESCQTVSTITATQNAALLQGVEVFPNPSTGIFRVQIANAQRGPITLRITDALGRTVSSTTLTKGAAALQHTLDLSSLSTGVYNLHFDMPDGLTVMRLLKQ